MLDAGWAAPTALGVVVFGLLLLYWLLRDRTPMLALQEEVRNLRAALADQAERHALQIGELNGRLDALIADNEVQHRLKHNADGRATFALGTLDLVRRYIPNCTCGALAVLAPLLTDMTPPPPIEGNIA